jgi:uncharacterized protein
VTRFALRTLKLRLGEAYRDEIAVELQPFELGGERYLPVPQEARAELAVTQAATGQVYDLRLQARLHGPCMRCLGDAVVDLPLEAQEYHDDDPKAGEEIRCEYAVEDQLDLSAWVRDLIAIALPDPILCRPDCAGLCPACGKDLNAEPHEHHEDEADPRWAALKELRDRL